MRGFRFRSSLDPLVSSAAADETKLSFACEKKPLVPRVIQSSTEKENSPYLPHPCCPAMSTEDLNQKSYTQLVPGKHWIISSFTFTERC